MFYFQGLKSLIELDLSHNQLTELKPSVFAELPQLVDLKLTGNEINVIAGICHTNLAQFWKFLILILIPMCLSKIWLRFHLNNYINRHGRENISDFCPDPTPILIPTQNV